MVSGGNPSVKDAKPGVTPICEATGMVFFAPLFANGTADLLGALLACIDKPRRCEEDAGTEGLHQRLVESEGGG
ncbi:hypothetical protein G6F64_015648 [Rhizopus arrhizus]|uniref:Uncharacterized protein n=1 Tax=Rhizopus oryzae TaxID=64495 RepID=A0A9P7BIM7_RHIOR|nr:hypothetical protein G6F64_015648 [Rhizopus arrhizus]